ncbi:Ceramide glucosyltransferase [Lachnellula suecica]|uniref:Ceramide glucosyltransferase n=1 Tax=Lachnellula suecica TaxID=602035 RepID=A0A8T9C8F6_9HELO|nr:Ceramide glucosyltransferase [Lachnellula suecica]
MSIRSPNSAVAAAHAVGATAEQNAMETCTLAIALACGIWYFFILLVQGIGFAQLYRFYSSTPKPAVSPTFKPENVPLVTILRPVKGLEPQLYECLAATFRQDYPREKLTIYFCVSSRDDLAFPVLQRLLADFPGFDASILVEEEDPNLSGHGEIGNLGPNPKIRNMSRGYREAKGDIIWVIDCNVWVGKGVAGRMVDKLCGFKTDGTRAVPYKFVHQLPLVVDSVGASVGEEARDLLLESHDQDQQVSSTNSAANDISSPPKAESKLNTILRTSGGRLEEMFMAGSHAKFYTAINTVSIAPCIVGKSNMFRRSHLNYLTSGASRYSPGIDFFSENICEDHLIGDLLWRKVVEEEQAGTKFHKHGLVFGDPAIQPMAGMSVREYVARRVRWLRVRKWTVTLATFVEPGVEPILCSAYGAFAFTTLPWVHNKTGIPQSWLAFFIFWMTSALIWMGIDSLVYAKLHSGASTEVDADTPSFARPTEGQPRRSAAEWVCAWLGREFLALPIWSWACLGGTTVMWRGKKFHVGLDMRVVEIGGQKRAASPDTDYARSRNLVASCPPRANQSALRQSHRRCAIYSQITKAQSILGSTAAQHVISLTSMQSYVALWLLRFVAPIGQFTALGERFGKSLQMRKQFTKSKSKESSSVGDSKPTTPKPKSPAPEPHLWSEWEWSTEGSFYYRARKGENDEWEYETSAPAEFTAPAKETPRTIPFVSVYYERPKAEYPSEVRDVVYVSREAVYECSTFSSGSDAKDEYTWASAACEDMKVGGGNGAKAEELPDVELSEAKKDGKKDGKKEGKGLRKSDVDEWRKSVGEERPEGSGAEAAAGSNMQHHVADNVAKPPREKKKEHERKEWRRREKRK